MFIHYIIVFSTCITLVISYNNRMFTLINYENVTESQCGINDKPVQDVKKIKVGKGLGGASSSDNGVQSYRFVTINIATAKAIGLQNVIDSYIESGDYMRSRMNPLENVVRIEKLEFKTVKHKVDEDGEDYLAHWPTGKVMRYGTLKIIFIGDFLILRAETFQNKSSVHLPFLEYIHRGHCRLKITKDYMQTAVDAFAIFISGDLSDVERLPGSYVLQSARTIAMMRVAHEKLAATWNVVRGSTPTNKVSYETLERYRPLFKYVNGREMARLNLSDNKILSFIGTHPDLNRHQVGMVASRYIKLNPRWTDAKYLNIMNNLLCGVPMIFMRRIPENTYLQLTHQIFYHIRACDPLQRRFYLAMMMRTQALGKSYSWSAREVSRLGLLLAEVSGPDLSAINPEAMSGITSQVMLEMPIHSLKSITEMQLRYLEPKPLNILARKLLAYQAQQLAVSSSGDSAPCFSQASLIVILCQIISKTI